MYSPILTSKNERLPDIVPVMPEDDDTGGACFQTREQAILAAFNYIQYEDFDVTDYKLEILIQAVDKPVNQVLWFDQEGTEMLISLADAKQKLYDKETFDDYRSDFEKLIKLVENSNG